MHVLFSADFRYCAVTRGDRVKSWMQRQKCSTHACYDSAARMIVGDAHDARVAPGVVVHWYTRMCRSRAIYESLNVSACNAYACTRDSLHDYDMRALRLDANMKNPESGFTLIEARCETN